MLQLESLVRLSRHIYLATLEVLNPGVFLVVILYRKVDLWIYQAIFVSVRVVFTKPLLKTNDVRLVNSNLGWHPIHVVKFTKSFGLLDVRVTLFIGLLRPGCRGVSNWDFSTQAVVVCWRGPSLHLALKHERCVLLAFGYGFVIYRLDRFSYFASSRWLSVPRQAAKSSQKFESATWIDLVAFPCKFKTPHVATVQSPCLLRRTCSPNLH